ncbi:MAG TPA: biotin/lipoyl-containing protein [Steroidobacteraceae bacterium]|nr:biotin/lipoyl-containing protein [Steroidobacteraceae bacterium]
MTLTARDIAEITRLLEDSSFDELELELDGLRIHLKKGDSPSFLAKGDSPPASNGAAAEKEGQSPFARKEGLSPFLEVRAPLLGTFYRAPKPGAPPFVEPGAAVEPDTVIGIIEVMKLMNAVRAGARGVVHEIRARDGKLVEYGETLLLVDPRETR